MARRILLNNMPTRRFVDVLSSQGPLKVVLLVVAGCQVYAQPSQALDDPTWGCYDAQPEHPTEIEKRGFIEGLVPAAQNIERNGGPPAAGMLAMASLESGFGFTRTALFANNIFGWKYTSAPSAGGRVFWTLACQPSSDPGNKYVVFQDRMDSLSFVGRQLTELARYKGATGRYHTDRAAALPVEEAVGRWVRGIQAAGYNPNPTYPNRVLGIANDFLRPGLAVSPVNGLYKYSAETRTARATSSDGTLTAARIAAELLLRKRLQPARYLSQTCDAEPVTTWLGYDGRAVSRCTYSVTSNQKTLSAIVYLLNPSVANLTERIANACAVVGLAAQASCGRGLAEWIVENNGGQFPVAGLVVERKQDAGGKGSDPVYLEFRDGTTIVSTDRLNFTDRQLTTESM